MPWQFIAQVALSLAIGKVQQDRQKRRLRRQRRLAAAQAADAAAVELRIEGAGSAVPAIYGYAGTRGIGAHVETVDRIAATVGTDDSAGAFPTMPTRAGSAWTGRMSRTAGSHLEVALKQTILSARGADPVALTVDGAGAAKNDLLYGHLALRVDEGGDAVDNVLVTNFPFRTAQSRFRGFGTVGSLLLDWDRGAAADQQPYRGDPDVWWTLRGAPLESISGESVTMERANIAMVLWDYLGPGQGSSPTYGPRLAAAAIDAPSFRAARSLCQPHATGDAGQFWAGNLPQGYAARLGSTATTWRKLKEALGFIGGADNGERGRTDRADDWSWLVGIALGRHEFHGGLDTGLDWRTAIDRIVGAAPGAIFWTDQDGLWRLDLPDPAHAVDDTLDEGDLVDFEMVRPDMQRRLNRIHGEFISVAQNGARDIVTVPTPGSALDKRLLAADGGERVERTDELHGCAFVQQAASRLYTTLMVSRRPNFLLKLDQRGLKYEPGDVLRVRADDFDETVRVDAANYRFEAGSAEVRLEATEWNALDYQPYFVEPH